MAETFDAGSGQVVNNEKAARFEMRVDGHTAILTYRIAQGSIFFDHTLVPPAIEGRGVASKMTQVALEFARLRNLRVVPLCSFVVNYVAKHTESHDLLEPATLKRILG